MSDTLSQSLEVPYSPNHYLDRDFFATSYSTHFSSPKFEQMAGEMSNVVFLKVDGDEAKDAAEKYNTSAPLTFVLLKNGQKIADLPVPTMLTSAQLPYLAQWVDELTELVNKDA